jgi:hypothetical protein
MRLIAENKSQCNWSSRTIQTNSTVLGYTKCPAADKAAPIGGKEENRQNLSDGNISIHKIHFPKKLALLH